MAGWQLGALLTELREGRLHDVSDQVSGAALDYLWTDARLIGYLNEAHRRFARESLVIRDGTTPAVTQLTTVDGTLTTPKASNYQLHQSVIAVLSVRLGVDPVTGISPTTDLARAGHDGFDTYHQPDNYFFDPNILSNLQPGKPLAWSTDEDVLADPNGSFSVMNLRLYPVVSPAYAGMPVYLRVLRLPIKDFSLSNLAAYPEIPADHHLDIIDWAAYLALSNVDTDIAGGNAADRAKDFKDRFTERCREARRIAVRKLFAPTIWGFGQNGWTWES